MPIHRSIAIWKKVEKKLSTIQIRKSILNTHHGSHSRSLFISWNQAFRYLIPVIVMCVQYYFLQISGHGNNSSIHWTHGAEILFLKKNWLSDSISKKFYLRQHCCKQYDLFHMCTISYRSNWIGRNSSSHSTAELKVSSFLKIGFNLPNISFYSFVFSRFYQFITPWNLIFVRTKHKS